MYLLLVEDDLQLSGLIAEQLRKRGYQVDAAYDGERGLSLLRQGRYDGCILDRMLPGLDGLTLLRRARAAGVSVPVLMLTAMSRTEDLVDGFENGADDYLSKPFAMPELLVRVDAMLRRGAKKTADGLSVGDLTLDTATMTLTGPSGHCTLTRRETDILSLLMETPGQVIPREHFFQAVWGMDAQVGDASLDTYIYFLRRRLQTVGTCWRLTTRRGKGYLLQGEAQLRECRLMAEETP
ncbi:MAG: response regulator transcription factor [Clostridiales bacterium]|nr:response regulator transcription factor [Clostridiales bacterium]